MPRRPIPLVAGTYYHTFIVQLDTIGNRETFELGIDLKGDLIDFSAREGTHAEGFTVEGRLKSSFEPPRLRRAFRCKLTGVPVGLSQWFVGW